MEIAAIDITISTASDDVTTVADEDFTQTVTVDVSGNIADPDYGEYTFAMNIDGLPEWLTADGELEYSSSELQDSGGAIDYHHEFTISGKPSEVSSTELAFTATVTLAGDSPILQTDGSKGIKITVVESVVSSDESPDIPPDESPDIPPEASPDIPPESSPDIPADASPDIPPEASPDIPASESPDIPPETSPDIPAEVSPDVPPDEGATIDTTTMEAESISEILESLTPEEAASVTSLKIGNNITDLSGLEAFSNLTTLDLTEATSIKTVDLSGSTVETVNAQGNNSIETVDVSDCENLKTLDVSNSSVTSLTAEGCSNLEEVDVSGCQNLEILDVSDTPITTLNAENCTNLEEIDCANCMLDELQIEGCNNLVKIDCRNNRLHKFDAGSFNKLDELLCRNQRITGWVIGRVFSFLNYFMMNVSAADGENAVSSGIENITNVKAWDADGQEISVEFDAETGTATFGKAPAQITYDYATGFRDVLMDVTVIAAEQDTPEPEDTGRLGSPGGCNTTVFEFSGAMMVLALLLFRRKRS